MQQSFRVLHFTPPHGCCLNKAAPSFMYSHYNLNVECKTYYFKNKFIWYGGKTLKESYEETKKEISKELREELNDSEMILIGLGEEFYISLNNEKNNNDNKEDHVMEYINQLAKRLEPYNYFVVATFKDDILRNSRLNQKRIVYPNKAESDENEAKQWDFYNKWLSATLAKKLLIIELGEGFENPNIIRWPFERITMINQKAKLFRIHSELFQIPKEIGDKAISISENAFEFLKTFLKDF